MSTDSSPALTLSKDCLRVYHGTQPKFSELSAQIHTFRQEFDEENTVIDSMTTYPPQDELTRRVAEREATITKLGNEHKIVVSLLTTLTPPISNLRKIQQLPVDFFPRAQRFHPIATNTIKDCLIKLSPDLTELETHLNELTRLDTVTKREIPLLQDHCLAKLKQILARVSKGATTPTLCSSWVDRACRYFPWSGETSSPCSGTQTFKFNERGLKPLTISVQEIPPIMNQEEEGEALQTATKLLTMVQDSTFPGKVTQKGADFFEARSMLELLQQDRLSDEELKLAQQLSSATNVLMIARTTFLGRLSAIKALAQL